MRKAKPTAPRIPTPNPIPEIMTSQVVTSQRTDKIFAALSKAQGAVEKARRSKKGSDDTTHQTWEYAGLDDVLDAVKQARADNELGIIERFPAGKAALHAILTHSSGQWIDYGAYAFGDYKTQNEKSEIVTRARRHFMKCMFGVVDQVEDADGDTANNRAVTGEQIDEPLAEDTGGRQLTDKERRAEYQTVKDEWLIKPIITADGRKDFHQFAADYEALLDTVKSMNDLSLLQKANSITLNELQEKEPELFEDLQNIISPIAQKFI